MKIRELVEAVFATSPTESWQRLVYRFVMSGNPVRVSEHLINSKNCVLLDTSGSLIEFGPAVLSYMNTVLVKKSHRDAVTLVIDTTPPLSYIQAKFRTGEMAGVHNPLDFPEPSEFQQISPSDRFINFHGGGSQMPKFSVIQSLLSAGYNMLMCVDPDIGHEFGDSNVKTLLANPQVFIICVDNKMMDEYEKQNVPMKNVVRFT